MIGRKRNVGGARHLQGFAVIQRFELRELFQALLDQIAEFPH